MIKEIDIESQSFDDADYVIEEKWIWNIVVVCVWWSSTMVVRLWRDGSVAGLFTEVKFHAVLEAEKGVADKGCVAEVISCWR